MAYSPEKFNINQQNNIENENDLKSQEEIDREIEAEAVKLNVSITELMEEINKFGGPEKFKEAGANSYYVGRLKSEIIDNKESIKLAKWCGVIGAIIIKALDMSNSKGIDVNQSNFRDLYEKLSYNIAEGADYVLPALETMFALPTVIIIVAGIVGAIQKRQNERKLKRANLKNKMVGVE